MPGARGMLLIEGRPTAPARQFGGSWRSGTAPRDFLGIAPPATWSSVGAALTPFPPARAASRYRGRVLIGFVGAGLMGSGMVRNLAAAGHEVRLYARTPARAAGLPATLAASVAEAVDGRRPGLLVRDRLRRRRARSSTAMLAAAVPAPGAGGDEHHRPRRRARAGGARARGAASPTSTAR